MEVTVAMLLEYGNKPTAVSEGKTEGEGERERGRGRGRRRRRRRGRRSGTGTGTGSEASSQAGRHKNGTRPIILATWQLRQEAGEFKACL